MRRTAGVALPFLLLLLVALTLLAHGTVLLARREYQASMAFLHATRAREAARSALAAGLARAEDPGVRAEADPITELVDEDLPDGLSRRTTLRWLSREFFFLEGEGRSRGWPGVHRVGGVGWQLDPLTRMRAFHGGVEVGGGVVTPPGGAISADRMLERPESWQEGACLPYAAILDSLPFLPLLPALAPLPPPREPDPGEYGLLPGLGLLGGRALMELGEGSGGWEGPGGQVAPGCTGSGEPSLWIHEGSARLEEGGWCGLLVVAGDLILEGDGLFQGLLLVAGDVLIRGGWTVQGMGRIGGALQVDSQSGWEVMACPALRVLTGIPTLRVPLPVRGAWNLTLY